MQRLSRLGSVELEPGVIVSFAAHEGELPGVVKRVFERTVEVDFNHPLAGRTIVFDVSIIRVEDLSRQIPLDHDSSSGE